MIYSFVRKLMERNTRFNRSCVYPTQYPTLETKTFDPFSDTYPNLYEKVDKQVAPLCKAIYWLQEGRVENLLSTDNSTLTERFTLFGCEFNPIELLCNHVYYDYTYNLEKILRIAKLLCEADKSLVTSRCFRLTHQNKFKELESLLLKYSHDGEDVCYVCLRSEPLYTLLSNLCQCKMFIHIDCFTKLSEIHSVCKICKTSYRINCGRWKEWKGYNFFPFDDIYPVPLFRSAPMQCVSGTDRIAYALGYAQPDRLKNLFETLSQEDIDSYFETEYEKAISGHMFYDNCSMVEGNGYYMKKSKEIIDIEYAKYCQRKKI